MTKQKIEERVKEHERDIKLNKETTAIARLNKKSLIQINFKEVQKLANYINLNYALMREATEIDTEKTEICNDVMHVPIDNRWRHLLDFEKKPGKLE